MNSNVKIIKSGFLFTVLMCVNIFISIFLSIILMMSNYYEGEQPFWFFVLSQAVAPIIMFVATFFLSKIMFASPSKEVFFKNSKTSLKNILIGVILGFFAYFVVTFVGNLNNAIFSFFGADLDLSLPSINSTSRLILFIVLLGILPAIVEEFIYRGAIFNMAQNGGSIFAVIFSSLCFGFMHMNFFQIGYAIFAGLLFACILVATKDIWLVITIHLVNNVLNIVSQYLFDSFEIQKTIVFLGMSAFEWIMLPISIVVFVLFFMLCIKKSQQKILQEESFYQTSKMAFWETEKQIFVDNKTNFKNCILSSISGFVICLFVAITSLFV